VLHPGETEPVPVNLTREVVHIETVLGDHRGKDDRWEFMLDGDDNIGYIRITSFSRDTTRDLRHALRTLTKRGLKGLVLDLRFNPGGLLSEAINCCDLFISEGTIVSIQGRNVDEHVWKANAAGTFEGFPIAVLVNHYSASASEILSACLQDHNRGIIVGERTWGKGSVQNVVELEGGRSALKLTTASYLRPSGKNIHRFPDSTDDDDWGVLPNNGFEVDISRRELEHLYRRSQQREVLIWHSPDSQRDSTKTAENRGTHENNARGNQDHQLQTALDYIRQQLSKA